MVGLPPEMTKVHIFLKTGTAQNTKLILIENFKLHSLNLAEVCGEKEAEVMSKCLKESSDGEIVSSRQNYKHAKLSTLLRNSPAALPILLTHLILSFPFLPIPTRFLQTF